MNPEQRLYWFFGLRDEWAQIRVSPLIPVSSAAFSPADRGGSGGSGWWEAGEGGGSSHPSEHTAKWWVGLVGWGDVRPTGRRSVPPGSQKADPEWAGRRSGKAPWKIPLGPPKPQKGTCCLDWSPPPYTHTPPPPATSLCLCPPCLFPRFYHISSTGSWKSAVIASSVMPAGGGAKGQTRRKVREGGGGGREEGGENKKP